MNTKTSFEYDLRITDLELTIIERDNVEFSNPVSKGDYINEHNCKYKVTSVEHYIGHYSSVVNCHVISEDF